MCSSASGKDEHLGYYDTEKEAATKSEYQGVNFRKDKAKKGYPPYCAYVSKGSSIAGKTTHVGYFESEVEAARAYDESPFLKPGSKGWKRRNILKHPDLYGPDAHGADGRKRRTAREPGDADRESSGKDPVASLDEDSRRSAISGGDTNDGG